MSTKCFNLHITDCVEISANGLEMFGKPVEFVWIQGIITSLVEIDDGFQLSIDDGTSVLMVISPSFVEGVADLAEGEYVLVQGSISKGEEEASGAAMVALEARNISPVKDPNMETLWNLEVMEGMKRSIG